MFVKYGDVKEGDVLIADDGFTCMTAGSSKVVLANGGDELFVECDCGMHFLDGQFEPGTGELIGFTKKRS